MLPGGIIDDKGDEVEPSLLETGRRRRETKAKQQLLKLKLRLRKEFIRDIRHRNRNREDRTYRDSNRGGTDRDSYRDSNHSGHHSGHHTDRHGHHSGHDRGHRNKKNLNDYPE